MMMKDYMMQLGSFTVKNILIDLNILLDYYENKRREKYPSSVKAFDILKIKISQENIQHQIEAKWKPNAYYST